MPPRKSGTCDAHRSRPLQYSSLSLSPAEPHSSCHRVCLAISANRVLQFSPCASKCSAVPLCPVRSKFPRYRFSHQHQSTQSSVQYSFTLFTSLCLSVCLRPLPPQIRLATPLRYSQALSLHGTPQAPASAVLLKPPTSLCCSSPQLLRYYPSPRLR